MLTTKAVGKFWDFQVKREADVLVVENAEAIADLPKKRRPPFKGGPRSGGGGGRKTISSQTQMAKPHVQLRKQGRRTLCGVKTYT